MTGHAKNDCRGWMIGQYTEDQCRVCWNQKNAATRRTSPAPSAIAPARSVPVVADRPPCVHLGPLQSTCPLGDTLRDVRHCLCENTDAGRCWRSAIPSTDMDVASCERCPHYDPGLPADRLTLTVTHWQRPDALRRLQESIRRYLPTLPVLIEDTGGNLSAGRNKLIGRTTTEFVVVMEEDFVILPETAAGLRDAVAILDHDAGIAGVGGIANEPQNPRRGAVRWGHNMTLENGRVRIVTSWRPLRQTQSGVRYRPCDIVLNWGVFRRSLYDRFRWDEDMPIQEHEDFFWRTSRAGVEFAYYAPLRCDHMRDRPNAIYNAGRNRKFWPYFEKKHGVKWPYNAKPIPALT